ncbi:MAG: FimB/Mfa2 family fimbrial subunit [Bacteroidales bacterium]|nr:FimB/Mfa2 family fimbrial subunit [Bacteroidales bacterium]
MNHFHFLTAVAATALICATSCSIKENRIQCEVPVHVSVTNDFTVTQEDIPTKAVQSVAENSTVSSITLAFYTADGTLQYKADQLKADTPTGFGDFSLTLPYGSYKMIVIAHGSEKPILLSSMTEAAFDDIKPRETFLYTRDLTINSSDPKDLSATLSRIITRLDIISTDACPENLESVRITFAKGGEAFNPLTGLSTTDNGFAYTITGITPIASEGNIAKLRSNFFLFTDEESMDVTIETLDASGTVLNTRTVAAVPFKRNRNTTLTGSLFSTSGSATFSVENSWTEGVKQTF